jgi:hypothetical protein
MRAMGWLALLVLGCLAGCGTVSMTPSDVVVAAYREANGGHFSQADTYLTSDLKSFESQDGGSRVVWRVNTRNQSLVSITPTRTNVSGDTSTVEVTLVFSDGCRRDAQVQLHQDWDGWRISRIGGGAPEPYPACAGPSPNT